MNMGKGIVAALVMGLLVSSAWAGPVQTGRICESAVWAAHVDFEALTRSALATGMMELITGEQSPVPAEDAAKAVKFWEKLAKVKSVTVFGATAGPAAPVLVADLASYDQTEVEGMLGIGDGAETRSHGDHTLYAFTPKHHGRRKAGPAVSYVCFYNASTIVGGADLERVGEALDLLDGKGAALAAESELAGLLAPAKGSVMVAAATGVKDLVAGAADAGRAGGQMAVMQKVQTVRVEAGELEAKVFGSLEAVLTTEQDAANLLSMAQGLLAMAAMQPAEGQKGKDLAAMLKAITVSGEGRKVSVGISVPVEDILSKIQAKMLLKAAGAI